MKEIARQRWIERIDKWWQIVIVAALIGMIFWISNLQDQVAKNTADLLERMVGK